MDNRFIRIFLVIVLMHVCSGERNDDLSEMFRNVKDIFTPNIRETTWNSAKSCPNVPQCLCIGLGSAKGLQVNCKGRNLTHIPTKFPLNTTRLILAINSISSIPDKVFQNYKEMTFLDLSYNKITQLGPNAFTGLVNLEVLNLDMNRIKYTNTSIHSETFTPLKHLTAINLQQDLAEIYEDERYPIQALTGLAALTQLAMDGLPDQPFNEQFLELKSLEILHLGRDNGRCKITNVSPNMFQNLPNLIDLEIQGCKLRSVQNRSFVELPKLESLDLSYNEELEFKSLANISYGLQFTNIQKLTLIKIHTTFGDCTTLTAENLRYLYNTSVKYMFLDSNRLSIFESQSVGFIPLSLIGLSLRDNKLMLGKYVVELGIAYITKRTLSKLEIFLIDSQRVNHNFKELFKHKTLTDIFNMFMYHRKEKRSLELPRKITLPEKDIDRQPRNPVFSDSSNVIDAGQEASSINIQDLGKMLLKYSGVRCENCQNISKGSLPLPIPTNLTVAGVSNLKIHTTIRPLCFCENKLQNLSLDRNTFWYWNGPLLGLTELKNLNLAWDYCEKISIDFFHYFPKLEQLNISGNYLGFPLSTDNSGIIFSKLAKLEVLHLTDNKIKFLPPNIFKGLKVLRELHLGSNQINVVNWNTDHMTKLRLVDLRENQIINIAENVRSHWDSLAVKGLFSVNLANNSFKCNCKYLDLIKWFSETDVNFTHYHKYTCKFDNDSFGHLVHSDIISRSLTKQCANYFTLILATSLAVLAALIAVVAGIAYRYRWNLRYMYYSAKFKLKGYSPVRVDEEDFENDVFVSYADGDGTFVRRHLVLELENNRGLNLLVHDRDFTAGSFVNDNIMHAITTSRKTLIIMSKHFLRSKWCIYEMNMARMEGIKTGRDVVCILMKEEVPTSGLPLEIIDIIRQKTYLEYPNDNENHTPQFWDRLADAIKY